MPLKLSNSRNCIDDFSKRFYILFPFVSGQKLLSSVLFSVWFVVTLSS